MERRTYKKLRQSLIADFPSQRKLAEQIATDIYGMRVHARCTGKVIRRIRVNLEKLGEWIDYLPLRIKYQADWEKEYDCAGSYQTAIMRACEVADRINLVKLNTIYPEIVSAYKKFTVGEKKGAA